MQAALASLGPSMVSEYEVKSDEIKLYGFGSPEVEKARAEAEPVEWPSPPLPYLGKGSTPVAAFVDLWRQLKEPLSHEGTIFWRVLPLVEHQVDFETDTSQWRVYCRVGVFNRRPRAPASPAR